MCPQEGVSSLHRWPIGGALCIDYVFKHPIHSKNNPPGPSAVIECAACDVYVSQLCHDTLSGLFVY